MLQPNSKAAAGWLGKCCSGETGMLHGGRGGFGRPRHIAGRRQAAAAAAAAGAATAPVRRGAGTEAPVAPRTLGLFTFPGISTPTVVP